MFDDVGINFSVTILFLNLVRECLIKMLNRDLKYLFTDKSLTTCITFINPVIFSGGWQPEGKRFPLLGSVPLCQFYFYLHHLIMPFNKHSSVQSYHLFDIWCCKSEVANNNVQKAKRKPRQNHQIFFLLYISWWHYAISFTMFHSFKSIS